MAVDALHGQDAIQMLIIGDRCRTSRANGGVRSMQTTALLSGIREREGNRMLAKKSMWSQNLLGLVSLKPKTAASHAPNWRFRFSLASGLETTR